jgi:hypothetical protein
MLSISMLSQNPGESLIDLPSLGLSLTLALVMGLILGWHFLRFAQVLSNKRKLARVLMFICVTTLLMIVVVKSSLALSLGLVGALSIIRFRTPIKEPEELAYLFLAIATGVGLGAERIAETCIVFAVVLAVMAFRSSSARGMPLRTVVQISAKAGSDGISVLVPEVTKHCQRVDLRRVDHHEGQLHASFVVELASMSALQPLLAGVQTLLPGASVSVVERDSMD